MQGEYIAVLAVLVCSGLVQGQSSNSIDVNDGIKKLQENFPDIGNNPELQKRLNNTKLPNLEDMEKILKQKCEKQGAPEAPDMITEQQELSRLCVEQYLNFTAIQAELDEAAKTGSMDEVFTKYCKLWPEVLSCFDNATDLARKCMDDKEEVAFNKTLEIVSELQEFMCFKDGDRLAMFVAEGGVECLRERKEGVAQCVNDTLGARIPDTDDLSINNLPVFLYSNQDCQDFDKVKNCVVNELEKCKDSTPANIVDAFFKFLKKQMPCKSEAPSARSAAVNKPSTSSSSALSASIVFVVFAFVSRFL